MGLYISGFCERQHPLYPDSFLLIQRRGFGPKQALRILRLLGNTTVKKVITTVGAEQEYFLIDKKLHDQRKDLIYTGFLEQCLQKDRKWTIIIMALSRKEYLLL